METDFEVLEKMEIDENTNKENDRNNKKHKKKPKEEPRKNLSDKSAENEKVKEIPSSCNHLLGNDLCVYVVPGDGSCGASSAAVYLLGDEIYGPKLRSMINRFIAQHFKLKYKLMTYFPLERNIGTNKKITFNNENEFCEFLVNSEESCFMWMDSVDLCALSDLFQLKIKVISTGLMESDPSINTIVPDKEMKKFSKANLGEKELVLIHENENHFNVVLSKSDKIIKDGTISSALLNGNLNVFLCQKEQDEKNSSSDVDEQSKELNKLKEEYENTISELRKRITESEKLKIELRDIRQAKDLSDKLNHKTKNEEEPKHQSAFRTIKKPQPKARDAHSKNEDPQYN